MAVVSPEIRHIGWLYIPVVLLASSIALVVALICNNMQRRYPTFWWTPPPNTPPSVFPTVPLSQTLTRTLTWTSELRTLRDSKGCKKRGKHGSSGVPLEDKDWHYALKTHSKVFGSRKGRSDGSSRRTRRDSKPALVGRPRLRSNGNEPKGLRCPIASERAHRVQEEQERKDKELSRKHQNAVSGEDQWEDVDEAEEQGPTESDC